MYVSRDIERAPVTSQPDLASNCPNFFTYKYAHFFKLQLEHFSLAPASKLKTQ